MIMRNMKNLMRQFDACKNEFINKMGWPAWVELDAKIKKDLWPQSRFARFKREWCGPSAKDFKLYIDAVREELGGNDEKE